MPNFVFTQTVLQDLFKEGDVRCLCRLYATKACGHSLPMCEWLIASVFNKFSSAYSKAPAVQDLYQIVVDFQLFAIFALSITQQAVKLVWVFHNGFLEAFTGAEH